jgi:hypothetical protein
MPISTNGNDIDCNEMSDGYGLAYLQLSMLQGEESENAASERLNWYNAYLLLSERLPSVA